MKQLKSKNIALMLDVDFQEVVYEKTTRQFLSISAIKPHLLLKEFY